MKKLGIEKIISELEAANIRINPEFLKAERVESPLLRQVAMLLDEVGEQGLKLTAKGNLPTKVVKRIALCCPTPFDSRGLEMTKRFLEEEQVTAMRARVVAEVGDLLIVSRGKIRYDKMAKAYREASDAERLIYLMMQLQRINLAYFDRRQKAHLINGIYFVMLQLIRDKAVMFREPKAYIAFLIDQLPEVVERIESEILPESYSSSDPFDEFERLVEIRLFKNVFVPLGLMEERGVKYNETYECRKTPLVDDLFLPFNVVDNSIILTQKEMKRYQKRISDEGLDIDLLHDFFHIYTGMGCYPLENPEHTIKRLLHPKRLIGTALTAHEAFYREFIAAAESTLRYFTQMEVIGGGERSEQMQREFLSFANAVNTLLPRKNPFRLVHAAVELPFFMMDMIRVHYGIEIEENKFYNACAERFGEGTSEDIGRVLYIAGELQKKGKKFKRINSKLEESVKELVTAYIIVVMSMFTSEIDRYNRIR